MVILIVVRQTGRFECFPTGSFKIFTISRMAKSMKFRNVKQGILKLKICDRLGRVLSLL